MIDIHHFNDQIDILKNGIKKSTILTERNKLLLLKFSADCQTGWSEKKLSPARVLKLLSNTKRLSEMIKKDWDWVTKDDIRDILDKIDTDSKKGEWSQHDYRVVLRKFISWLRNEYGYPDGYPQKEELNRLLTVLKYPSEINKMKIG